MVLRVMDEGDGIPPAELEHIFDKFYRARKGDQVRPGTGLGLAIVKKIMEDHGGRLGLEDRPRGPQAAGDASSAGARAVLTLPWRPAQDRPAMGDNDRPDGSMRRAHGA